MKGVLEMISVLCFWKTDVIMLKQDIPTVVQLFISMSVSHLFVYVEEMLIIVALTHNHLFTLSLSQFVV